MAGLINLLLSEGQEYTDPGKRYLEERYGESLVRSLIKKTAELGMHLLPCLQPA